MMHSKMARFLIIVAVGLVTFSSTCVDAIENQRKSDWPQVDPLCVSTTTLCASANINRDASLLVPSSSTTTTPTTVLIVPRGGGFSLIPGGYNPFGYKVTELGLEFLEFDGSLDSDVGRFLASVRVRKRLADIKSQWLEIVRASKTGQSMRIYRTLDDVIKFCVKAGFLD
jgi:hypothetical protein